ncbi:MAG: dihydroorotate dehydrogenase [Selenomonadaceae bacterium]|nr:dihydroorotate dehydrogenase [Selenomonadaceae bacterium]
MANFSFLRDKPEFALFAADCIDAEEALRKSPDSCIKLTRPALDAAVKWLYLRDKNIFRKNTDNLFELLGDISFATIIGRNLLRKIHHCRKLGNQAIHNEKNFTQEDAVRCLSELFEFVQWLDQRYGKGYTPRIFDANEIFAGASLKTELCGIKMNSPVLAASGTFGFGEEFADFVDIEKLGGVMVKCITLVPRAGNSGVRITETPSGMLNAIGLENPGVEKFLAEILPRIKDKFNVIVNISGSSVEDYGELAKLLNVDGVAALELNISCPNVKDGGIIFGTSPKAAAEVTAAAKKNTGKPVIVKLSPNVTDITEIARAVESAGADCVSLINTLMGMEINVNTWKPTLGNITGGLSGGAIKPVAVRMVWQVAQAVKIPVIGMGGIRSAEDAVEFFLAGASAVAVGTANFANPSVTMKIIDGLENYLAQRNLRSVNEIIGRVVL